MAAGEKPIEREMKYQEEHGVVTVRPVAKEHDSHKFLMAERDLTLKTSI